MHQRINIHTQEIETYLQDASLMMFSLISKISIVWHIFVGCYILFLIIRLIFVSPSDSEDNPMHVLGGINLFCQQETLG